MQATTPTVETDALLDRLSQRPGVQSVLILSRDSGAIVRSAGLITAEDIDGNLSSTATTHVSGVDGEVSKKQGTRKAEDVAGLVWEYVKQVSTMVRELNGENDEAKLLRIRTKKNELVVVPDAKFLLVCIHDTPPA